MSYKFAAPGSLGETRQYCVRSMGSKWHLFKGHYRSFDIFVMYCITPPVYPEPLRPKEYLVRARGGPQLCIACGKVHVTSEECGVPERPDRSTRRTAIPRQHDGYTLQRADNMGAWDDSDTWKPSRRYQ